jgi:hypothetical protein
MASYHSRFGDNFCLIINGSHTSDDAYVIPYSVARRVFTPEAIDHRGRWIGTVINSILTLTPSGNSLNVSPYHNSFELVGL